MTRRQTRPVWQARLAALVFLLFPQAVLAAVTEETYLSLPDFLSAQFGSAPAPATLWFNDSQRQEARAISGEDPGFRQRYWRDGNRVAWVFNVIGRDHPITVGVVVDDQGVRDMQVLVYRESRGWEVKYDFFTSQFHGASLEGDKLDRHIDNITGATLSVRAMKRAARLALWGYRQVISQ